MKHVVVSGDLRGSDLRSPALLERFRNVSAEVSRRIFGGGEDWLVVPCPACGSDAERDAFRRGEFTYRECLECGSLYVSPRPDSAQLHEYFNEPEIARFRAEYFGGLTGEARTTLILESRGRWVARLWDEAGPSEARAYVDVGTTYTGLLDQLGRLGAFESIRAYRPAAEVALDGFETAEDAPRSAGAVGLFEQAEHQFDLVETLEAARDMLVPGGLLFMTTRSSSGFDMKMLGASASYIFVPEHLNLISVEGAETLMERLGLEVVELSTPGQLDVDLVRSNVAGPEELPPFIRYMFEHRDHETLEDFQIFLQKNRLSSHLRIAAAKKGT